MDEVVKAEGIELRHGRWQDVLADVAVCDALITDPPYSDRTHRGSDDIAGRARITYGSWTHYDVRSFVKPWAPRARSWFCAMTSHDLIEEWEWDYEGAGRYGFAPVPILQHRPRLTGDGPGSCAIYLMVSRPKERRFMQWGSLPGWYEAPMARTGVTGSKPLGLMRAIVRDYTQPGNLVVDPCAGSGTTLIAAAMEGRRAIGAEVDYNTFKIAKRRIEAGCTPDLFGGAA